MSKWKCVNVRWENIGFADFWGFCAIRWNYGLTGTPIIKQVLYNCVYRSVHCTLIRGYSVCIVTDIYIYIIIYIEREWDR